MRSSARCWAVFGVVVTSKVGVSGAALGVRQVLRTMVVRLSRSVRKLCAGLPSARVCDFERALRLCNELIEDQHA